GAFLVNPYDLDAMAETIHRAFHLPHSERSRLMQQARQNIKKQDIHWWLDRYLETALKNPEKQQECTDTPARRPSRPRPVQSPVHRSKEELPAV
ncbi:MAG: trehalose-6-phosphate synthase, partial [Desulfohalobiaceae bacterium]|nr:trehalose-6-phosphate synthase [Desulfohalobiaceae bacterium]